MSDSEVEYQSERSTAAVENKKAQPAKKKATTKRKTESCNTPPTKPKLSKTRHNSDLFGLEDVPDHPPTSSRDLGSSLLSRVANGKVRRTADLNGEFYVEVKVYHKGDIISTAKEERWKKAAVALKVQLDRGSAQWDTLQSFMRRAHELFDNSEPVYFSDQFNFK